MGVDPFQKMSSNQLDEGTLIGLFRSMCPGATQTQARDSLSAAGGDVDLAVAMFVSASDEVPPTTQQAGITRRAPPSNSSTTNARRPDQEYYVGGGSSGQAVVEPAPRGGAGLRGGLPHNAVRGASEASSDDSSDDGRPAAVKSLFNKARENGAVEAGADAARNQTVAFSGHGRRLGHTEGPSPAIAPVVRNERSVKISFYKNGFTVDDEPNLRPMDGEAEKEFLDTLNRGFIPREISQRYPGVGISVVLADHSEEAFTPPAYVAFSGSGHRLAAPSNPAATANATPTAAPSQSTSATVRPFEVKDDEPTGKILLLTPDNRRIERTVNPDRHTVGDVRYGVLRDVIPGIVPDRVELLLRNVPPRPLSDDNVTIRAANAVNGVIMIKIRPA